MAGGLPRSVHHPSPHPFHHLTAGTQDLDKWQLERRVTEPKFPSLLAFLGYSLYFPGFLVGPFLEYAEYDALVTEKLFKSATPPRHLHDPSFVPKRLLPSGRKRVGYFKLVTGLVYLGLFVTLYGRFNYTETLKPWFGRITLAERYASESNVPQILRTDVFRSKAFLFPDRRLLRKVQVLRHLDSHRGPCRLPHVNDLC